MPIAQIARKHGIADDDMLHAVRNPISQWHLDVLGIDTDDPVIVHAMRARPPPHR